MSFLISLWPHRCQQWAHIERRSHQNTAEKPWVPIVVLPHRHIHAHTSCIDCMHENIYLLYDIHSHAQWISKRWKTWRKPEQERGSSGRKQNTPLVWTGSSQEKRTLTGCAFRELELYELEDHDWIRMVAHEQLCSSLTFQNNNWWPKSRRKSVFLLFLTEAKTRPF